MTGWRRLAPTRPKLTIRVRLTLSYAGMVTGSGAVLIGLVWAFMRFVPSYAIVASGAVKAGAGAGPGGGPGTGPSTDGEAVSSGPSGAFAVTSASDFLHILLLGSAVALLVLAVLGGAVGWVVAGRIIEPLAAINKAATLAATGSLDHRLAPTGPRDEIRDLAETFDGMLDGLQRSFDTHRRFAANASHELRTPLATTQTMIDVALADDEADAGALRELARRIRLVNAANIQTVDALLDLADIDSSRLARAPVDLRSVVTAAVDGALSEAADRRVTIVVVADEHPSTQASTVVGDTVLLRQTMVNLVQNAVRHNIDGGTVAVRLDRRGPDVVVTVCNTGTLVPADVVESLREPFVRNAGRVGTGSGTGHGLGLTIAASVVDAHDGELTLTANTGGGLTVEVALRARDGEP